MNKDRKKYINFAATMKNIMACCDNSLKEVDTNCKGNFHLGIEKLRKDAKALYDEAIFHADVVEVVDESRNAITAKIINAISDPKLSRQDKLTYVKCMLNEKMDDAKVEGMVDKYEQIFGRL